MVFVLLSLAISEFQSMFVLVGISWAMFGSPKVIVGSPVTCRDPETFPSLGQGREILKQKAQEAGHLKCYCVCCDLLECCDLFVIVAVKIQNTCQPVCPMWHSMWYSFLFVCQIWSFSLLPILFCLFLLLILYLLVLVFVWSFLMPLFSSCCEVL